MAFGPANLRCRYAPSYGWLVSFKIMEEKEKILFFMAGEIPFAARFSNAKEIINISQSVLTVPFAPSHVSGVINFKGSILAVINILNLSEQYAPQKHPFHNILVFRLKDIEVGILINEIPKIEEMSLPDFVPVQKFNYGRLNQLVDSEVEYEGVIYGILNAEKIIKTRELNEIKS